MFLCLVYRLAYPQVKKVNFISKTCLCTIPAQKSLYGSKLFNEFVHRKRRARGMVFEIKPATKDLK
jgi:hypothetical protein